MNTKEMVLAGHSECGEWFLFNSLSEAKGYDDIIVGIFQSKDGRTGWFQDSDSGAWIRVVDGCTEGYWREEPDWEE